MTKRKDQKQFMKIFNKLMKTIKNGKKITESYDDRKVCEKIVRHGLCVSTCWTEDCGFETAILDANGTHPVERYKTKEEAKKGHVVWAERLKTLTKVKKLCLFPQIEDAEVILERVPGWTDEEEDKENGHP